MLLPERWIDDGNTSPHRYYFSYNTFIHVLLVQCMFIYQHLVNILIDSYIMYDNIYASCILSMYPMYVDDSSAVGNTYNPSEKSY